MGYIIAFLIAFYIVYTLIDIFEDAWVNLIKPFIR